MKIWDLLTIDDRKMLEFSGEYLPRQDWIFIKDRYLSIFRETLENTVSTIQKTNKARFAANQYLLSELKKRDLHHWRQYFNEYGKLIKSE